MPTNRTATTAWRATRKAFIAAEKKKHPQGHLFCSFCKGRVLESYAYTHPGALQVHHVISPLDRPELEHVFSNLRIAHRKCNRDEGRPDYNVETKQDEERPEYIEGRWYPMGTTGVLNADGYVVGWLAEQRLWLNGRWWTEAEAIAEQKALRERKAQRNPFRREA